MTSNSMAQAVNLEHTVGAYFLGAIASVGLSGITTLQSWLYFQKYPRDPIGYKLLVASAWTLEFVRSCITVHGGYFYAVKNWCNAPALAKPVWSMKVLIFLTNLIILGVHCFFVHKVWKATHAKVLCGITTLFVLGEFGLGLTSFATAVEKTNFPEMFEGTPGRTGIAAFSCAIGADWLITFALVHFFRENKTHFSRTNRLLSKLIFYAINMGLLVSVIDAVVLILLLVPWPTVNFYQLAVYEVVGNLYVNSLLACLNIRGTSVEEPKHSQPSTYILSSSIGSVKEPQNQSIQVSRHLWTSTDVSQSETAFELKPQETKLGRAV